MKPGSRDHKYSIKIAGAELAVLKECCFSLPESFGLDRRIEKYQGTRPIGFWRWDLDCLVDVLTLELQSPSKVWRRQRHTLDRDVLQSLHDKLTSLRDEAYKDITDLP